MIPVTHKEYFLAAMTGEEVELPPPVDREEIYLAILCGENIDIPLPVTVDEMYLAALCGMDIALPPPVTRLQMIWAGILGEIEQEIIPVTREEYYWLNYEGGTEIVTVTGVSPLLLPYAAAKPIKSLIQFGKCSTSGGEIYCNNGRLVAIDDELPEGYRRQIGFEFSASTYYKITGFHLRGSDTVRISFSVDKACNVFGCYTDTAATDNYSMYASTSSGAKYLRYDGDTYNSSIPSSRFGERFDAVIAPTGTTGMPTDSVITPATFESVADLHIGTTATSASSSKLDGCIWGNFEVDDRLTLIPVERLSDNTLGYYDPDSDTLYEPVGSAPTSLGVDTSHLNILSVVGTAEVLTIGEQTASVENLYEANGVADEQDIISGTITRKVGVSVANGVITLSALATPVTEHTTPQPLSTAEGNNTVSWTAEVSGTVKKVEYAYEAPSFEWKTASGAVVSVNDAIAGEVGALTVGINPVQTGSGDPSPDNVRPISGWTATEIFVSGVNIWNPDTSEAGYLNGSGQESAQTANKEFLSDYIAVPSGATKLTIGCDGLTSGEQAWFGVGYYKADKTWIKRWASTSTKASVTINLEADASYIRIMARSFSHGIAALFAAWGDDIPYAQYAGGSVTPLTIPTPPGTVYGGTLDVLTGVLTVTKANIASYAGETINEPWISSMDKYVSGTTPTTGAQVVYTLTTPQTVQLTPAQVSTLLGTNVIWASGNGEVSVTYRAEVGE